MRKKRSEKKKEKVKINVNYGCKLYFFLPKNNPPPKKKHTRTCLPGKATSWVNIIDYRIVLFMFNIGFQ